MIKHLLFITIGITITMSYVPAFGRTNYVRNPFYYVAPAEQQQACRCTAIGLIPGTKNAFAIIYIHNTRYKVRTGDVVENYKIVGITAQAVIMQDNVYNEWIVECGI